MIKKFLFPLMVVIYFPVSNTQELLQAGPMPGYSEMREVALWVQTRTEAAVIIEYWDVEEPDVKHRTQVYQTRKTNAYTAEIQVDEVEPGKTYAYNLFLDSNLVNLPFQAEFSTQQQWQFRTDPPEFAFATGSCAFINEEVYDRPGNPYGGDYGIFNRISEKSPDFMLWLGDNIYLREADWNSWTGITKRYTHLRSLPELQALLMGTHHYAIWDDHDFGPNNGNRSFWNKERTLKAFDLFWANPSTGVAGIEGAITQFQWGDADFFLLDNRYHRSPNEQHGESKTILGKQQLEWLKDALVSSPFRFKIVAMGGQFLNDAPVFETYANNGFDAERQEIIDFIAEQNILNVIFITGDRHATELSVLEEEGIPRIIDITISPLTSNSADNEMEKNTLRVEGTYVSERNFGLINFSGKADNRRIEIEVYNGAGELIWVHVFEAL